MGIRQADLNELAARDALRRLVTAYSRAVDRRDFKLLRSLYHDEAFEEHGDMFTGGPDEYMAFVEKALSSYAATAHYVVNTSFEIEGDRAEGEVYKINYHRTHAPDAHEVITASRSLDRYRRDDGVWRFLGRSITLDWSTRRAVDADAYKDFAAGSPPGRPGPDDLSYQVLTLFGRHG
ncbi:nuclear transport factor 2 family protein [Aminobacter anthyllidis]|uniref:nuclear transport factor 2 family protein n=1 Tax=Aminobacter anthyllidis TaxID=1035067 RepID=UPI002454B1AB|nr:nuclear transport factor 2 family protein [Aminobacter anthyllidis]MDH4984710.1 nuclear transport factor 2 family protein [Aminobacter anthyllidis]